MEFINATQYEKDIQTLKYKPKTINIPIYIAKIIHDNDLMSIDNKDDRAKIFLRALYFRRLKASTVSRYFNRLKPYLFPDTEILPNSLVFDDHYGKRDQIRGSNLESIEKLIHFVKYKLDDNVIYKWPILISAYSGLRINEVCSITMKTLQELSEKKPVVSVKRKNNTDWQVVYYKEFEDLIDYIINKGCKERYELYINNFIDQRLYPFTKQALHNHLKTYYQYANEGVLPAKGFGMHSLRYYLATTLFERTNKIEIAQTLMGHKSHKTTHMYIKSNNNKRSADLENLYSVNTLYKKIKTIINEGSR